MLFDQRDAEAFEPGEIVGCVSASDSALIFSKRDIQTPVQGVLNRPVAANRCGELFDVAIQLVPLGQETHVKTLKGGDSLSENLDLRLDPATMLLTNPS